MYIIHANALITLNNQSRLSGVSGVRDHNMKASDRDEIGLCLLSLILGNVQYSSERIPCFLLHIDLDSYVVVFHHTRYHLVVGGVFPE